MSSSIDINKRITSRLKQGDIDALKEVYSRHWKNIFAIAVSFLKSKEDAEDAVQDIFMRFWQKKDYLNPNADYKPYLFRIARNSLVNVMRSCSAKAIREIADGRHPSSLVTEEVVEFNELSRFAQEAINKLPPKRKLVFDLRRNQGFTKRQIAREMGISITMVERQLKLANTFIKNYLKINADLDVPLALLLISIFLD
ncbi:sigma-70 family RNA polymerase sigma factor [Fulvivirgaceae bacterium BMA12]|uniref:Sigma-70 family RNA polymerase sigma factor n=1 Tax=Agaribacillus aureus TaxID=3051825 RepID=A0ABT8LEM7_9BACT|nr:sigma-70 family RNA polymerase sigma factor [Fulvivirgaceae bacterium BMA12]